MKYPPQPDRFRGKEIRAGEFPRHPCLHAICPTAFDPLQAPSGKHAASLFVPVPFQLKGKKAEDWVKLKHGFMESLLSLWRRYATNLTEDNIEMKVAMDPFYISGRWPNMRRAHSRSSSTARLAMPYGSSGTGAVSSSKGGGAAP